MLTPEVALSSILGELRPLGGEESVPISEAAGRVLAREVVSDLDLPPFEKSAMDGFAVHAADFAAAAAPDGERTLPILGESRAGEPFRGAVPPGTCVAIYTGAEVPAECDAVVMVERTRAAGDERVCLRDAPRVGQNICNRGQDLTRGAVVLRPGRRLRPVELSVLAAVGCEPVPVFRRPRVSVLTSGDELVTPDRRPGPGQIREGNTLHLAAMCRAAGAQVLASGIVGDEVAVLREAFAAALADSDVLITTGGVSMGKYDLVGETLEALGARCVFHKVAIKPGKPLWFGMRGAVPIFALPGNPVSCLVNQQVFVRPALDLLSGAEPSAVRRRGRWTGAAAAANERERYVPVRATGDEDGIVLLERVRWNGSADVVGLSAAEALAVIPADTPCPPGTVLDYVPLV